MEKGDGMSFSEFTYPLLQGWDWWHMYQHNGVQVQIGGSDQYGNIIAGMDAVKYIAQSSAENHAEATWLDADGKLKADATPMGLTVPLLTTASGEKFGKSAGNAVWLDRSMTSAFDLYGVCLLPGIALTRPLADNSQFLLRSSDEDVHRYLKLFTFIPTEEITSLMTEHSADPGKRKAQHLLASEVLELVHGREEATKTRNEHHALRNPSLASLGQRSDTSTEAGSLSTSSGGERTVLPSSLVLNTPFSRILYHAGIVPTKSEGTRLIAKGGAYVATSDTSASSGDGGKLHFVQIKDQKPEDVQGYLMNGNLVVRVGKWKVRVVEVVDDALFDAQELDAPGWSEWRSVRLPVK